MTRGKLTHIPEISTFGSGSTLPSKQLYDKFGEVRLHCRGHRPVSTFSFVGLPVYRNATGARIHVSTCSGSLTSRIFFWAALCLTDLPNLPRNGGTVGPIRPLDAPAQ